MDQTLNREQRMSDHRPITSYNCNYCGRYLGGLRGGTPGTVYCDRECEAAWNREHGVGNDPGVRGTVRKARQVDGFRVPRSRAPEGNYNHDLPDALPVTRGEKPL